MVASNSIFSPLNDTGHRMYAFASKIFPYFRSLTGDGVRKTLSDIDDYISFNGGPHLSVYEVPTGTKAFDWEVPKEWSIKSAYIEDERGNIIIDIKNNNLHVMGYSSPVDKWVDLDELKQYIYTEPTQPDVTPYVTSYYSHKERFGFCMPENIKQNLSPGKYHMFIDSKLFDGSLTYADLIIPGNSEREVMFSSYICHPSMANNECSGPTVLAELIRFVNQMKERRFTYRFVFNPENIGALVYLSQKERWKYLKKKLVAGFLISCVGDDRDYGFVQTKYADTLPDKVMENTLRFLTNNSYNKCSFLERGSDEQEYGGPNLGLPYIAFFRSQFGEYPEYHTSADNLGLISPAGFQGSYNALTSIITSLENNYYYRVKTYGVPQLSPRNLYPTISQKNGYNDIIAMMNFIAYADGRNDLIDISNIINVPVNILINIKETLCKHDLLEQSEIPLN